MPTDAESMLKRADAAFSEQSQQLQKWRDACDYCLPLPIYQVGGTNSSVHTPNPDLVNDTAMQARRDLSSGMSSAFINAAERWFDLQPSDELSKEAHKKVAPWLANATKIMLRLFPKSGFYDRAVLALDHAGAMGTSAMKIEGGIPGSSSPLNCETWDIGSYAIAENGAGVVDQIWREMNPTVDQAESMWPDMKVDKLQWMTGDKKLTQREVFVLEIRPRDQKEVRRGKGALQMPFEGTIIHKQSKTVVWRGGWQEFPVLVYRYARQGNITPWGTGPGIDALASARGVNYLTASLADGVDKMASPPLAVMDNIRGVGDFQSRGVTMVDNLENAPRPIFTVGNMQAGNLFLDKLENALRRHFHSDLFSFFLNDDRFKTATVAMQIASEKLGLFAPFAHRFLHEFSAPAIERTFMVCFRQGLFGKAPVEALTQTPSGQWVFTYPKVVQQSRMALALQEMGKQDVRQVFTDIIPVAQIDPTALDYIDFGVAVKMLGANEITMPGLVRADEDVAMMRQARAQAQAQQQQAEMMAQFATKNPDHAAAALAGAAA